MTEGGGDDFSKHASMTSIRTGKTCRKEEK